MADARLIAAAPLMLDALEAVPDGERTPAMRAAIAAAKGGGAMTHWQQHMIAQTRRMIESRIMLDELTRASTADLFWDSDSNESPLAAETLDAAFVEVAENSCETMTIVELQCAMKMPDQIAVVYDRPKSDSDDREWVIERMATLAEAKARLAELKAAATRGMELP